ncbi:hypothetical protein AAFF_G00255970 [Aldrovandia affinis]|uniref:SMB domain-containing protein n=1 Tax=Aldrovandia affinis TaxID=143900 RepID=A0AAD7REY2_9TELE|nr:hypothetical protein AAFF_G00255970 [Aldrovandia affinis]
MVTGALKPQNAPVQDTQSSRAHWMCVRVGIEQTRASLEDLSLTGRDRMDRRAILLLAWIATALAVEESCVGRCENGFDSKKKCQCDSMCTFYGSCCFDYDTTCYHKITRGDTFHHLEYNVQVENTTTTTTAFPTTPFIPWMASTPGPISPSTPGPTSPSTQGPTTPFTQGPTTPFTSAPTIPPTPTTTPTPKPTDPDAVPCSGRPFDSFMQLKNGSIYAFRGDYVFELNEKAVVPGYPKLIKDVWGISGPIDASFTRINCQGKTYLFKGNKYWRFEDGILDDDYPREISVGFEKIPDDVDAAFALPATNHRGKEKVYFFRGDRYTDVYCSRWTDALDMLFQGGQGHGHSPHFISKDWVGIKPPVDAVMAGRLYVVPRRKGRRGGRGRGGRGQKRRQGRSLWDIFDLFDDDYDYAYDTVEIADYEAEARSQPVQNVYFFKRDKYYRVDLQTKRVDFANPPYPRSIAKYWLGCSREMVLAEK